MDQEHRVAMYYDGGCPLCNREVLHYKKVDRAGRINWVDIDADATALESIGVHRDDAMKRLHVTDRRGNLVTGAYAFQIIWQELPFYRWLAKIVSPRWVLAALDALYSRFANRRYARRQRCTDRCGT